MLNFGPSLSALSDPQANKPGTVKMAIYAGGYVCIFFSQTIGMGIKYSET